MQRRRDDEQVEAEHPLSEDVSPPLFSMVALSIVGICLAVFFLLGVLP